MLDPFANSLQNDPNTRMRIVGHTDSTGSDAINNPLSVERAQSVRDYLAARRVADAASRPRAAASASRSPTTAASRPGEEPARRDLSARAGALS